MESEYRIVEYQPELRSGVLNLTRHIWGPDSSRNAACLDWKYRDNPNLRREPPLIFLALHGEKVIGMRGVHAVRLEADGTQGPTVPCFGDTVIDPEYRGRGLLTLLTEPAIATLTKLGYSYLLGVSNVPSTYFHLLKLGWRQAGDYKPLRRYAGRRRLLRRTYELARCVPMVSYLVDALRQRAHEKQSFAFANEPNLFASLDENSARERARISVGSTPWPTAMADLVRRLGSDGRIRQVRDTEYLEWRYKNPLYTYRFLFCGDHELTGYLVVQAKLFNNFGVVNLVDWEATTLEVRQDLLRTLLKWGHFNLLTIWSATLPKETLTLLQKEGFMLKDESGDSGEYRPGLLVRALRERNDEEGWTVGRRCLLKIENWDLRMIYSDGF